MTDPGTRLRRTLAPLVVVVAALLAGGALLLAAGGGDRARDGRGAAQGATRDRQAAVAGAYARLPLAFERNRGQTDQRVRFLARGAGYTMFLTPREAVLSIAGGARSGPAGAASRPAPSARGAVVRLRLLGGARNPRVEGLGRLPGVSNYLRSRDHGGLHTGVPGYARVHYQDVYPGIGLVYYGRQGRLEYDFHVAPGADPRAIGFGVTGARGLRLDRSGNLVISTAAGRVRQLRPVVYQRAGGRRHAVAGRYVLKSGGRVGFELGRYDHRRALVIDPVLTYSTYLGGGTGANDGFAIAADSTGAAYVAGRTSAVDFPTTSGALDRTRGDGSGNTFSGDAFVTKLSPDGGALVYSTYLGGDDEDFGSGIAVSSSGRAYVSGDTSSSNFPTTVGAFRRTLPNASGSAFVSVLKADGSALDYSTFLGGTDGLSSGTGVALDSSGRAYVTGNTQATDFPTKSPNPAGPLQPNHAGDPAVDFNNDAFLAKLDPTASAAASLVYSTYLGGSDFDATSGIAVDAGGNASVGGATSSMDFPTTGGAFQTTPGGNGDGFASKLNATGSALAYSTYLGGSEFDRASGIALDPTGRAYVAGTTQSTNFPTARAFQPRHAGNPAVDFNNDAFVTKLDPGASGAASLSYSSYLGGAGDDTAAGIAVTPAGTAYVAGSADTISNAAAPGSFPTVDPVAPFATGGDAFVSAVKPDGSGLSFSSYLGGGGGDDVGGVLLEGGVAVDGSGNAYLAGSAGSTDFPTRNAFQPTNPGRGVNDRRQAFVAKLVPAGAAAPLVTGLGRRSGPAGTSVVISGHGFAGAGAVRFGAAAASSFTVDSDGQITATSPPGGPGPVAVTVTTPQGISPANPIATFTYAQGTWDLTGSLRVARQAGQTTTLLSNGKVLVAGGTDSSGPTTSAELYDPASATWAATTSMVNARQHFTATLLRDGKVLVAGGTDSSGPIPSAELYDPAKRTWAATRPPAVARSGHTATLLSNGKVLVAGGTDSSFTATRSAELYDPTTGMWSPARSLVGARADHTATLLSNGKVLMVGGNGAGGPLFSAELYDPVTNSRATTGPLGAARANHTATLLHDNRVLVVGGDANLQSLSSAEIYDPATGDFSSASAMERRRSGAAAAPLFDGRVLVTGGVETNSRHNTGEVYDPATNRWGSAGVMTRYRGFEFSGPEVFAVPLASGKVLVGGDSASAGATTELFTPAAPGGGNPPAAGQPLVGQGVLGPSIDTLAPGVSGYGLTNRTFVVGGRTPTFGSAAKAKKHRRGTTFRYTLSEAATVRIVIARGRSGRRKAKRCVAPTRKLRKAKKCIRLFVKGTLTRTSHKGANSVAFSGRIGSKALKPGNYQATLTATDAAKNTSKPKTIVFRVVRR